MDNLKVESHQIKITDNSTILRDTTANMLVCTSPFSFSISKGKYICVSICSF